MSLKSENTDNIYTFKIFRFNPDIDNRPSYDTFIKKFSKGTTVLDALLYIQGDRG